MARPRAVPSLFLDMMITLAQMVRELLPYA